MKLANLVASVVYCEIYSIEKCLFISASAISCFW